MDQPSKAYKAMKKSEGGTMSKSQLQRYMKTKYFDMNRDIDELLDIDEDFIAKKYKFFIPGKIYTFPYVPPNPKGLDFFDKQPIIFSFYNYIRQEDGELMEMGVNINLIPPIYRSALMDAFWTFSKKQIDINEQAVMDGKEQQMPAPMDQMKILDNLVYRGAKLPYKIALESYVKKSIRKNMVRIVTYDDWIHLMDYVPNTIVGKAAPVIWTEFIMKRSAMLTKELSKPTLEKTKELLELKKVWQTRKKS